MLIVQIEDQEDPTLADWEYYGRSGGTFVASGFSKQYGRSEYGKHTYYRCQGNYNYSMLRYELMVSVFQHNFTIVNGRDMIIGDKTYEITPDNPLIFQISSSGTISKKRKIPLDVLEKMWADPYFDSRYVLRFCPRQHQ